MKLGDLGLTPNIGVTVSGNADSTTKSAISPGTIEVRSNPNQDLSGLSRDPSGALNAQGKIFDKKTIQEKQELAQVFGEEVFKAIGDLKLKEGSPEKAALDAFAGGLMAQLGGGSFASGAAGAGLNQLLMNELAKIKDSGSMQWASTIVGAVAAKIVGGDAQTGASMAASETKNNYLTHEQYREMLRKLEQVENSDKSPEEKEKEKAAIKAEYEEIDKEQDEKWQNEHQITIGDINANPGTISLEKVGVNLDGSDAYLTPGVVVTGKNPGLVETFIYDPKASVAENVHKLLSLGGFTPFAPVSEGTNAIIYFAEGDNESALMSAFAAIPGMKVLAVAKGAIKLVPETEVAAKFVQAYTTTSNASSRKLAENLLAAGVERPSYASAAHHIVAGNSPKANEARAILQKYGIDIDDATNGVFLPTVKDVSNSAYHPSLHTNAYYEKVTNLLQDVTTKEEAIDILNKISNQLKNGTFMN